MATLNQQRAKLTPSLWSVQTSDGVNMTAVNLTSGDVFSGTIDDYNAMFLAALPSGEALLPANTPSPGDVLKAVSATEVQWGAPDAGLVTTNTASAGDVLVATAGGLTWTPPITSGSGSTFTTSGAIGGPGTPVVLNPNGTVSSTTYVPSVLGTPNTNIFSFDSTAYSFSAEDPASGKVIIAGTHISGSSELWMNVISANGTALTAAGVTSPLGNNSGGGAIAFSKAGGKFLCVYRVAAADYARVGTLIGTTLTWGAAVALGGTSVLRALTVCVDPVSDVFVIGYAGTSAVAATISGNTVTLGTPITPHVSSPALTLSYDLANKHFIFTAGGKAVALSLVDTVLTAVGPVLTYDAAFNLGEATGAVYDPAARKVLLCCTHAPTQAGYCTAITNTAGTLTASAPAAMPGGGSHQAAVLVRNPDSGEIVAFYIDGLNSSYLTTASGKFNSNGVFEFGSPAVLVSAFCQNPTASWSLARKHFIVRYGNSSVSAGSVRAFVPPGSNRDLALGLSQSGAADAAPVVVKVGGQIDTNLTSLTPGTYYYLNDLGNLTTSSVGTTLFGRAVTSTELLIMKWAP